MAAEAPFRQVVAFAIGGGWGTERPVDGSIPVSIIRGTDFARLASHDLSEIPKRYEVAGKVAKRTLRPRDVVLEISGGSPASGQSTGRSFFVTGRTLAEVGEPVIPASFCRLVRFDEYKVEPRYAYYVLQDMYLSGRAADYEHRSTGISNFQFEYFLEHETIRLVPLTEQRAIAAVLGALDDKIELNQRMNQTLEAMARALFKSWFVDFDPVRAKAGGLQVGLAESVASMFAMSLTDSGVGLVPSGWRVATLAEVLVARNDRVGTLDVPEYSCTNDGLRQRQERFTKRLSTNPQANKLVRRGDIVFGLSRQVLNFGLMRDEIGSVSPAYKVFAVDERVIASEMLERLIRTRSSYFYGVVSASSREGQAIAVDSFRSLSFACPPVALQREYSRLSQPLLDRAILARAEIATLEQARDALLPKLISGEIRVPQAERLLEALPV